MELSFDQLPNAVSRLYAKLEDIERLLIIKFQQQTEPDQILTIQEAGKFVKLSIPTLYSLVSKRQIPVSKKGKRLYFSTRELTEWLTSGRRKTLTEIQAEADNYINERKIKGVKI